MRTIFLILCFIYSFNTTATSVYKCKQGNTTIFSQTPCDDTDTKVNVYESQPYRSQKVVTQNYSNDSSTSSLNSTQQFILNQKMTRKIKKIEGLTNRMNKELNILKLKSLNASNNLAGANYKKALSNEMITTSTKYQALIKVEQNKLEMMQSKSNL